MKPNQYFENLEKPARNPYVRFAGHYNKMWDFTKLTGITSEELPSLCYKMFITLRQSGLCYLDIFVSSLAEIDYNLCDEDDWKNVEESIRAYNVYKKAYDERKKARKKSKK
jgi:hypothetical protein